MLSAVWLMSTNLRGNAATMLRSIRLPSAIAIICVLKRRPGSPFSFLWDRFCEDAQLRVFLDTSNRRDLVLRQFRSPFPWNSEEQA